MSNELGNRNLGPTARGKAALNMEDQEQDTSKRKREATPPPKVAEQEQGKPPAATKKVGGQTRWRPGVASICTAGICFVCAVLDSQSMLPHPVTAVPGADNTVPTIVEKGLSSPQVRKRYHKRLKEWAARARAARSNLTAAHAELASFAAENSITSDVCKLAEAGVREREAARVEARLQSSAVTHVSLILRDMYVYGSLDPFTIEKMMKHGRRKMALKGKPDATDDEVCESLIESSTRANEAWDKAAEKVEGIGYVEETIGTCATYFSVVILVVYLLEVLFRMLLGRADKGKADKGEKSSA